MRRRPSLLITPAACAALVLAPTAAHALTTPAPPGQASGVALQVGSLLDISRTGATAGSGSPSAEASVLRLGGAPLLGLGGTQTGDGQTGGSLLDTGDTLPARVEAAPWNAAANGSGGPTRHAKSSAAAAQAELPQVVKAGVLTSDSEASWTDQKSGTAVTDGINVALFDTMNIVLLHSETSSEGRGHSYLVGLNGTEIGTDDQLGASPLCSLDAGGLLSLSCLTASGGSGGDGLINGAAEVVNLDPAIDAIAMADPVAAFTATSSSGDGAAALAPAPVAAVPAGETARADTSTAPGAQSDAVSQTLGQTTGLPRTGSNPVSLLAAGLTALFGGLGLRRLRPRTAGR